MSSTNKKGAGLILSLLTAVAGAVGLGFCIVNAGTDSFRKIGTSRLSSAAPSSPSLHWCCASCWTRNWPLLPMR